MAKLLIEIEDSSGGEMSVRFEIDDPRTSTTGNTNTATQNAAIYIAQQMRKVGLAAPDLG